MRAKRPICRLCKCKWPHHARTRCVGTATVSNVQTQQYIAIGIEEDEGFSCCFPSPCHVFVRVLLYVFL
jgi:hypothetical protein